MMAVDKIQVARQFSRAASQYYSAAEVQNKMADRLLEIVPDALQEVANIVDLGCGAGYLTAALVDRFPSANISGLDIAGGMLDASERYFDGLNFAQGKSPQLFQGDMEALPFATGSFDLVFSNAAIQWTDSSKSIAEIKRVLAPEGTAIISTFVAGTLAEWRSALNHMGMDGLHPLESMDELKAVIGDQNIQLLVGDQVEYRVLHDSALSLLESTKRIGATNASSLRRKGLMGRELYNKLISRLESDFAEQEYCSTYQAGFLVLRNSS